MNSDTVKPIPATVPTPTMCPHRVPSGSRPSPVRTASQENAVMPTSLPTTRPRKTPTNTADGSLSCAAVELDSGVGEGEQRHDDVARPRVQAVDQPVARRDRPANRERRHAHVGGVEVAAVLEDIDDLVGFEVGLARHRRSQQTHHDAGDRGVHAGLVDHQPQHQAEDQEASAGR